MKFCSMLGLVCPVQSLQSGTISREMFLKTNRIHREAKATYLAVSASSFWIETIPYSAVVEHGSVDEKLIAMFELSTEFEF